MSRGKNAYPSSFNCKVRFNQHAYHVDQAQSDFDF